MTKEITKTVILQEIQDKLKLREFEPEKFLFSEVVVPTYDITQHLKEEWQKYDTVAITGIGGEHAFTIPQAERWILHRYDVVFMSGAFTVSGVYITRPLAYRSPIDAYIYLDLAAAQSTSYHVELAQPVILDPSSAIRVNVDSYTSPGDLRIYIDYTREEVR